MDDLVAAIRTLVHSGDPAAARVAEALKRWWRSRTVSFEEALGAANGIRAASHQRERDEALRELARRRSGMKTLPLAEEVHKFVQRYETGAWARDRDTGHRPDGDLGLAYDVLDNGELPGIEHLRKVTFLGYRRAFDTQNLPALLKPKARDPNCAPSHDRPARQNRSKPANAVSRLKLRPPTSGQQRRSAR